MPRVSRAEKLERGTIERLQAMIENPLTPLYVQHRCMATLATMVRHRDKRQAEKAAAAAARRAERQEAERSAHFRANPSLPSNGREPPPDWRPGAVQPAFDPAEFVAAKGINKG